MFKTIMFIWLLDKQAEKEDFIMITKDIKIGELVRNYSFAAEILFNFGMGCVGCPSAQSETIEEACLVHGLELEKLLSELNKGLENK